MARLKRRSAIVRGPTYRLWPRYEIRRTGREAARLEQAVRLRAQRMRARNRQEGHVSVAVIERCVRRDGFGNATLFLRLATQAVGERAALRRPTLVDDALGRTLVELIAQALQAGDRRRIGIAGANVELLPVLAGQVRIDQTEV